MADPDDLAGLTTSLVDGLASRAERQPVRRRGTRQPIPDAVRHGVHVRDGWECYLCQGRTRLVLDHIRPWSDNGGDDSANLRTLCWHCNEQRSNYGSVEGSRTPIAYTCTRCSEDLDDAAIRVFCVPCGAVSLSSQEHVL